MSSAATRSTRFVAMASWSNTGISGQPRERLMNWQRIREDIQFWLCFLGAPILVGTLERWWV